MKNKSYLPLDPAGAARFGGDFFGAGLAAAAFAGLPRPFFAPFSSLATSSLAGDGASFTGFSAFFGEGFSTTASAAFYARRKEKKNRIFISLHFHLCSRLARKHYRIFRNKLLPSEQKFFRSGNKI